MKHMRTAAALALSAGLLAAPAARAQVYTPPFMSPVPTSDFGVYVSDVGDLGVEGIWRRPARGGSDLGLRAGYADVGDGALMLGIEVRNPVVLAGAPIGLAFTAGGQVLAGDAVRLGGQVGFSAGQAINMESFTVTPYIHPRLALVASPGNDDDSGLEEGDDVELDVRADVGADFGFASGITLRLDFNLAKGASWGLGLAWRQ